MTARLALPLFSLALLLTSTARADVAPPLPEDVECARGAVGTLPVVPSGALDGRGRPLRAWPYCAPSACASDADCTGGRVCSTEEIGLCVQDQQASGVTVREARDRGCEPNGTCLNLQSTCERARRCVAQEAPPAPPPPAPAPPAPSPAPAPAASGSCSASPMSASPVSLVLALTFALVVTSRARRTRRSC